MAKVPGDGGLVPAKAMSKARPSKQPKPISWEIFRQIRHGDVVVTGWDTQRAGTYRLVLTGPADYLDPKGLEQTTSKAYVQLPIHARSWTNRAYTLANFYDLKHVYGPSFVIRKPSSRWLCAIERDTLQRLGFDWARELLREIADVERLEGLGFEKYTAGCMRWLKRFAERAQAGSKR